MNFYEKIAGHATELGLTPAQVTAILADCAWLIYVLQNWLNAVRTWAQSCTDGAALAQTGAGGIQVLPMFTAPALPAGTVAVNLDALTRIFALVQQIKASGNVVDLGWGWQGNAAWLDACEILVDRGDGKGFVPLVVDTTPNYNDTQAHPAAKTIWTYKATYRANDRQVGLWSNAVSVTVGG